MITWREALTRATDQLSASPLLRESALADAVLLLLHTLSIERATLLAHPERLLDRDTQAAYQRLLERRLRFEPVQYILGSHEFYGLVLHVTPAVLIPRPETELLVEAALARLPVDVPLHVADVGTGSGAIAIAVAVARPRARIVALDLSPEAIHLARENADAHGVADRIELVQADLLGAGLLKDAQPLPFDAILSNPPYVPAADAATLHPQVREYEPALALFAGPEGMDIYNRLIPQAAICLRAGGLLAMEFGYGQADALKALLAHWETVELLPDLQGIPRVAVARR